MLPSTAALAALGLPEAPVPSPAAVKARWRELAAVLHPDRGGDGAEFARLRAAYEAALELATAPRPCPACGGSGRVLVVCGWSALDFPCDSCAGRGTYVET